MTRYLVFTNKNELVERPEVDSAEYVACEIASSAILDSLPAEYFLAYPENSPAATFESLKGTLKLSLELDQARIDLWLEELRPIRDEIDAVHESIDQAYCLIVSAVSNLGSRCERSQHFSDENLAAEISFQSAFDEIGNDSAYQFFEKICELYGIQHYQTAN